MKPLRLIRTTTIKLAFYILAGNDKKCTLFDYICFREVKHKPIDYSPSDRIKTARQIGERKILKVLNPTGSRNRQTIYSLSRFLASLILYSLRSKRFQSSYCVKVRAGANVPAKLAWKRLLRRLLILFQKFFKKLKHNSHKLLVVSFVSTSNNHANQKTTCLLSFRSHVSCLFWETENKLWKVRWTDTLGRRHSLRSKRFLLVSEQKKDRGKGFSVFTARELKREPTHLLSLCS